LTAQNLQNMWVCKKLRRKKEKIERIMQ